MPQHLLAGAAVNRQGLSALQAAVLLVSASYGIGFLFGSGELAVSWGMAGSVYAVATAGGMLLLAWCAPRIFAAKLAVWDRFGASYGSASQNAVALLSLLWMGGVLAAQIRGGVAVARLMGLPDGGSYAVVCGLVLVASRLNLATASKLFSTCLFASNAVRVYALFQFDGVQLYLHAMGSFAADAARIEPHQLAILLLAVVFLVVTGADYQQFVTACRSERAAWRGCVAASAFLLICGFLPASVVIAFTNANGGGALPADGSQVMPFIMAEVARHEGGPSAWVLLATLLGAALGSGAAISRAMASAAIATLPLLQRAKPTAVNAFVVAVGALVAARGQAIVSTMVSLNIVYIASIAVGFAALYCGLPVRAGAVRAAMYAGFATSLSVYVWGWVSPAPAHFDLLSLILGLAASGIAATLVMARRREGLGPAPSVEQAPAALDPERSG